MQRPPTYEANARVQEKREVFWRKNQDKIIINLLEIHLKQESIPMNFREFSNLFNNILSMRYKYIVKKLRYLKRFFVSLIINTLYVTSYG